MGREPDSAPTAQLRAVIGVDADGGGFFAAVAARCCRYLCRLGRATEVCDHAHQHLTGAGTAERE